MSSKTRTLHFSVIALIAGLEASAQTTAPPPAAQAPASAPYNSAFEGYRPFAAEEIQDWRRSNDTVREIGGWRAYAREISGSQGHAAQPGAPAPVQQPKGANTHEGHHR